jgi:hypothetical protein
MDRRYGSKVECPLCKHEALSSNPVPPKKEGRKLIEL